MINITLEVINRGKHPSNFLFMHHARAWFPFNSPFHPISSGNAARALSASTKWRPAPTWTPLSTAPPSVFPHVYPSVAKPPPRHQPDTVRGPSSADLWPHSAPPSSEEQTTSATSHRPTIVVAPPPPSVLAQYEYDQQLRPTRRPQVSE